MKIAQSSKGYARYIIHHECPRTIWVFPAYLLINSPAKLNDNNGKRRKYISSTWHLYYVVMEYQQSHDGVRHGMETPRDAYVTSLQRESIGSR